MQDTHRGLPPRRSPPGAFAIALAALLALLAGCGGGDRPSPAQAASSKQPAGHIHKSRAALLAEKESVLRARLLDDPTDLKARLELANFYFNVRRPQLAVPAYLEVLKHQPDNPSVRTDLGTCYKRLGKLKLAQAEYERVRREHPGHIQSTYNLAVVCDLMGEKARAAQLWERVGGMAPNTPIARRSLRNAAAARAAMAETDRPTTAAPTEKGPPE